MNTTKFHRPDNPGPMEQSDNQQSPSKAKPEDFQIYCDDYSDKALSVTGQDEDDPEAAKRSTPNSGSNYTDSPERP
jgi:hypothetical protein